MQEGRQDPGADFDGNFSLAFHSNRKAFDDPDVGGDFDKALEWLRKKGVANAAKRSDNQTAEGFVGLKVEGKVGSIVQLSSETDFVARNELFQTLVVDIVDAANKHGQVAPDGQFLDTCMALQLTSGTVVSDAITELVAKVRENVVLSNAQNLLVET